MNVPINVQATGHASSLSAQLRSAPTAIREFLAFKLGSEEYGMDILRVQEIRSCEEPAPIANALTFIQGMVNLRGVIVIHVGQQVLGMVVDDVSDAISPTAEQLRPVPGFSSIIGNGHLLAIGSVGDRMLILSDIEKPMSSAEMGLIAQTLQ